MFTRDNYIVIPGFAIADLHLSGNELIVFSLIYGFSQDSDSEFKGSISYIAGALNIDKRNVKPIIDRLIEKGYVNKREEVINSVKFCRYSVNVRNIGGMDETSIPMDETSPNNNIDIIDNKKKETLFITEEDKSSSFINETKKEKKSTLTLPYESEEFRQWWEVLKTQPKWRNKSVYALKLNLNDLAKMGEQNAIESMKKTIKMGWQGVFAVDAPKGHGIHNVNTFD